MPAVHEPDPFITGAAPDRSPTLNQANKANEANQVGQQDGAGRSTSEAGAVDPDHESAQGFSRAFAALRYRDFRYFWIGGFISGAGRFFQVVTLPTVIWQLTEDPAWVGFIGFTQFLPMALMAPIGGPLADRWARRKMLLVTQSLMSVVALALALMWWGGVRSPHAYAAVAVLSGLTGGLNLPAWQAFVSELVPRHLLLNAVTLNSAQFNSSRLIGPVLAGVTVAAAGPGAAFAVNAATYLAVIAALVVINAPGTPKGEWPGLRPVHNIVATARYVRRKPGIDIAIGLVALIGFFGLSVQVLSVVFASDVFQRGSTGYGLMLSMLGAGAVLSAPIVASLGGRVLRSRIQGVALIAYGAALLGLATAPTFELSLIPLVVMGAAHLATASTLNTTVQLQVDENRRAQVIGLYLMALMLASPIGQLAGGQMIKVVGPRFTFGIAGTVLITVALWLTVRGGLTRLDAEASTHEPAIGPDAHPTPPSHRNASRGSSEMDLR